jgi:hypothetical protein
MPSRLLARALFLASCPFLLACTPVATRAPAAVAPLGADSVATRTLAPGVTHRRLVVNAMPWVVHVVEVDLRQRELELRAAHAFGRLEGRERTSAIARRVAGDSLEAIVAVNADFFSLRTGEMVNSQVIEGRLYTGFSRAAYGARQPRSHFAVTPDGRPLIERFVLRAAMHGRGGDSLPVAGINVPPVANAIVLRRAPAPDTLPADSTGDVRAVALVAVPGDTTRWIVAGPPTAARDARMPANGALLVARGSAAARLARVTTARDTIRVTHGFAPARGPIRTLVGGWPRLLTAGVVVGDTASEGAVRSFVEMRHPRTAIGFSRDSSRLYLVVVDGRQRHSAGMTIAETARTMRDLGAWDALNLDGGGSTTLVLRDSIVNIPSDRDGDRVVERAVGNALLVVRRK